jgi:nucleotide-binding universal stress UspA family protein
MSIPDSVLFRPVRTAEDRQVVACIDNSAHAPGVAAHAHAIASALDLPVTFMHVLDARPDAKVRPDPIEWDLRRHEARRALGALTSPRPPSGRTAQLKLSEGVVADEICRYSCEQSAHLLVIGASGGSASPGALGGTARSVLEQAPASILLVPGSASVMPDQHYRRILVPLDGSKWAESVLPLAVRLAKSAKAELILTHVVPTPEFMEPSPLGASDRELRDTVVKRNELFARSYLERMQGCVAASGIAVRTLLVRSDDARTQLTAMIAAESADLVILSARGNGGRNNADLPYGSVAAYLMTHSPVPVLMVRPSHVPDPPAYQVMEAVRLPVAVV